MNGNTEETSFPVAYILLDCCHAHRDNEFLQLAVHTIKETMSHCELNFLAYKSPDELMQTCLTVARSLPQKTSNPLQLVWVSFYDFANLSEDAALAVMALHNALFSSTSTQARSILIRGGEETDVSFQWSVLINAHSLIIDELPNFLHENVWLVGVLEVESDEFAVYCDPFMPFPKQTNQIAQVLGCVERSIAEPYLDSSNAQLAGNMDIFEGRSLIQKISDRLYFAEPSNNNTYTITPIMDCFYSCILKRLQPIPKTKRRSSVDSQASQNPRPAKSSPKEATDWKGEVKTIKEQNKAALKKLLLLSLRKAGISTSSKEFNATWKHLYCGCIFALRKELDRVNIDQSTLISIIQANMRTFNIK